MRFIFVRHGKTHFNEINLTQGWCDSPLSKWESDKLKYFKAARTIPNR